MCCVGGRGEQPGGVCILIWNKDAVLSIQSISGYISSMPELLQNACRGFHERLLLQGKFNSAPRKHLREKARQDSTLTGQYSTGLNYFLKNTWKNKRVTSCTRFFWLCWFAFRIHINTRNGISSHTIQVYLAGKIPIVLCGIWVNMFRYWAVNFSSALHQKLNWPKFTARLNSRPPPPHTHPLHIFKIEDFYKEAAWDSLLKQMLNWHIYLFL